MKHDPSHWKRYEYIPYRVGGVIRVWKKKSPPFFKVLLKDVGKLFKLIVRSYRKELVVGSVLLMGLFPSPQHVKAEAPPAPIYIKPIARLQPVVAISVPVPPEATPVPEPTPPPAPVAAPVSSSDCVTGYSTGDYYLDKIISYESGGNSCATNYLGCFGLLQACAGEPLRTACGGNPTCQIAWFQANKTGGRSWAQVWQHELDFGWW